MCDMDSQGCLADAWHPAERPNRNHTAARCGDYCSQLVVPASEGRCIRRKRIPHFLHRSRLAEVQPGQRIPYLGNQLSGHALQQPTLQMDHVVIQLRG
jgi:hypothetical protein